MLPPECRPLEKVFNLSTFWWFVWWSTWKPYCEIPGMKIHLSSEAHKALLHFEGFEMESRGIIHIKVRASLWSMCIFPRYMGNDYLLLNYLINCLIHWSGLVANEEGEIVPSFQVDIPRICMREVEPLSPCYGNQFTLNERRILLHLSLIGISKNPLMRTMVANVSEGSDWWMFYVHSPVEYALTFTMFPGQGRCGDILVRGIPSFEACRVGVIWILAHLRSEKSLCT